MSKDLFTLRDSDGRLLKYDGVGWNTIGTYTPVSWPAAQYRLWSLFSFRGQLHTFWMSNSSSLTYNIGRYSGTDITLVSSINPGSSNINTRISNWVNYRGVMYCILRRTNSTNFLVLSFDGTNLFIRTATEMGAWNTPSNDQGFNMASMNLFVHDERLFLGGRCLVAHSTTEYRVRNWLYELDIQSSIVTSVAIPLLNAASTNIHYSATSSLTDLQLFDALNGGMHSFSLNGKLYRMAPSGILAEISDINYAKTPKFDIRDDVIMARGTVTTTAVGDSTYPIKFAATVDMGSWFPNVVGAKVSYGGEDGIVVGFNTANLRELRVLKLDGTAFTPVPNGAVVTVTYGLAYGFSSASLTAFATTYIDTEIVNGVAYICITGRNPLQGSSNNAAGNKTFIIKYDGVNPPSYYELTVLGNKPNAWGMDLYKDPEDNKLHLTWADAFGALYHHAYFDTLTDTWTYIGSFQGYTYSSARESASQNNVWGWATNEGDATITAVANNATGTNCTITYILYSQDSHTINVAVEYDVGNGYQTSTSAGGDGVTNLTSSPSGLTKTFIHNNAVDLPAYSGPIQYRVRILP